MNLFNKNKLINEMKCGDNFSYILNDNNIFSPTEYKILQSQIDGTFVKCMKLLNNGNVQLYYLVSGIKSFSSLIPTLNSDIFMSIVSNLFIAIISVKNNGFLSCQNIDISFEHIFVEPKTYKIRLVYLPISKRIYNDITMFENEIRTNLIRQIQNNPSLVSAKTSQFVSELSNNVLSLENLSSSMRGTYDANDGKTLIADDVPSSNRKTLKLIATNSPVPFEILVTKNEFILGRKQELVDGVIPFNKMIGRTHCKIVCDGKLYTIIDLNSTNGTYVNGVRIQPEQPCLISEGDIIKLANSRFQIKFS